MGNLDMAFDISQLGMVSRPSDPYVICSQGDKELFRTETVKDSANPEFNHKFSGTIDRRKGDLVFTVFDEDTFKADDYIGRCTVPIATTKKNEGSYSLTANEVKKGKRGVDMPHTKKRKPTAEGSTLQVKVMVEGGDVDCFGDCVVQYVTRYLAVCWLSRPQHADFVSLCEVIFAV